MGSRNLDRIPISMRRARCETVADMIRDGWDVISKCQACELLMQVDLGVISRVKGGKTSLWNRRQRCRRMGCRGFVDFMAKAPGMNRHESLRAEWPASKPPKGAAQ
jgi:hypothetical protein